MVRGFRRSCCFTHRHRLLAIGVELDHRCFACYCRFRSSLRMSTLSKPVGPIEVGGCLTMSDNRRTTTLSCFVEPGGIEPPSKRAPQDVNASAGRIYIFVRGRTVSRKPSLEEWPNYRNIAPPRHKSAQDDGEIREGVSEATIPPPDLLRCIQDVLPPVDSVNRRNSDVQDHQQQQHWLDHAGEANENRLAQYIRTPASVLTHTPHPLTGPCLRSMRTTTNGSRNLWKCGLNAVRRRSPSLNGGTSTRSRFFRGGIAGECKRERRAAAPGVSSPASFLPPGSCQGDPHT